MENTKTPIENLPKQSLIKVEKSKKKGKTKKNLFEYIDANLETSFLNNYFQELKKKQYK